MHRYTAPAALMLSAFLLAGCSTGATTEGTTPGSQNSAPGTTEEEVAPAEPLDLTGEWKQTNSKSEDSYQAATISGDVIEINWVNEADSGTAIYWVGTYDAPTEDVTEYTWESANDTSKTENALLASSDPTKTFTFKDGVLSYELTAMGVTMTVEMSKQ